MLAAGDATAGSDAEFDETWHDGRAELSGYSLKVSRYGQARDGKCVMIFVTEPFSESKRVKADDPDKNPKDTFNALKLNLVRDFQTGIYDYNTMVSVFVRSDNFSPAKVSFSSAEWCGHVYKELLFHPHKIDGYYASYFEDESGPVKLDTVDHGVAEDNLFILLRGLRGDYLKPGEVKEVPLLPSVYFGRVTHTEAKWTTAEITRGKDAEKITVPAGDFTTMVYKIKTADGRNGTFYIEDKYPHRIIRWEMLPDMRGELTGSERLPYWKLNRNGHESYLEKLGL
jgi:hypothetical protein